MYYFHHYRRTTPKQLSPILLNRRKMCACFDSSRKSTPPRAPVHYGTWRKRQTTLCTSSPSACLGRVRWANPCASERQRRPRHRPLRVKVKKKKKRQDTRTLSYTGLLCPFQGSEHRADLAFWQHLDWFSSKDPIKINRHTKREMKFHNRALLKAEPCWPPLGNKSSEGAHTSLCIDVPRRASPRVHPAQLCRKAKWEKAFIRHR